MPSSAACTEGKRRGHGHALVCEPAECAAMSGEAGLPVANEPLGRNPPCPPENVRREMSGGLRLGCGEGCSQLLKGEFAKFICPYGYLINIPLHFPLVPQEISAPTTNSYYKAKWFLSPGVRRVIHWPDFVQIIPFSALYMLVFLPHPFSRASL